jgi:hypothetical protein
MQASNLRGNGDFSRDPAPVGCLCLIFTSAGAATLAATASTKPDSGSAAELLLGKSFGISEWQNHYRGDGPGISTPAIIDECVEAHHKAGLDGIVWNAGRATILYHSDLPHFSSAPSGALTRRTFRAPFTPLMGSS